MYKIIGADQQEYGPITADQIRQWITEGRVNGETKICAEGTQDWKPLAVFPEFGAAAGAASPESTPALAKPPGTIKVFGILNIVFGSLGLLCSPVSLIAIAFASKQLHYSPFMTVWVYISVLIGMLGGIVMLASGVGLVKMRPWSRPLAVYYSSFAIALTLLNTLVTLTNMPEGGPNPESQKIGAIIGAVFGLAIGVTYNILVIYFLTRPNVKEALGEKD